MDRSRKRIGYVVAIIATALVLLLRLALSEVLAEQARLMLFVLAVMLASWLGGLGPGILATALAAFLGVLFIVPPEDSLRIENVADGVNAFLFVVIGITISYLCEALHVARRRETEKQFQTLANSIPHMVWMARPDGHRFWHNNRWHDYTGTKPDEVGETDWQQFHDAAELPRVICGWRTAVATGEPWEETYPLRRKDGQMRWHLTRALPIRNDAGEIVCWFGTCTDIQDRIEIEQALKEADAQKDQFLATLAHELRNPLTPISNAIQLWPHVVQDQAEMEHLRGVMERQVRQLIRLIDDLMDVSRITRGKINLRLHPVDLGAVIAMAVETVQPYIDESGHQLTVTLPDEPMQVMGDGARLTQVFSNVLNNATKYTSPQGVISLGVEKLGDRVAIRVRDNGPGISADMLTKIFEPFRQVEMTLDRSHGGLGIGLMLARQLLELQGGTIEAHSEGLGHGSEFVTTLPILEPAVGEVRSGETGPLVQTGSGIDRHRILVVDDLPESAEMLVRILRNMGQDATPLNDGKSAIEWVLLNQPDVVFLDIAMPGLDGYEVARRLRAHPELAETVLAALTGYGQQEDRKRAIAAGFNIHLTKPPNLGVLNDLLQHLPAPRATADAAAI